MEDSTKARYEAVIDVTRPAFEGIEGMGADEVARLGLRVAATYLEDRGYEVLEERGGAVGIVADDGSELVAVGVASRRSLGCMPADEPEPLDPEGLAEEARGVAVEHGAPRLRLDFVGITFLSDRVAHIWHAQCVGYAGER